MFRLFLIILSSIIMSGCVTTPKVFTDFDNSINFSKYQTFSWIHEPPMMKSGDYDISPLAEQRMTNAIKSELEIKGFTFTDNINDADFTVVYTMGARDKINVDSYSDKYYHTQVNWGWGAYYYPYFKHYPFGRHSVHVYHEIPRSYTEGSIAIDIYDARTQQPIWHSKASKKLSSKDFNSNASNAFEVAQKLLTNFPPVRPANITSPWSEVTN